MNLSKFNRARLVESLRYNLGISASVISQDFLGREVKVRYGTINATPDYDYGWAYALINQCSTLYDVGCNVGLDTLVACLDDPRRKVVTIDANPQALAVAAENLFLNGFSQQVQFILSFVSDTPDEEIDFFTVGTGAAGSRYRSHAQTASAKNSFIKVKTTTLDKIVSDINVVPDLVKVDVEGAEAAALDGAKELTVRYRPRFLVEMHSHTEQPMGANGDKVLAWCREVEYDAYYLKEHKHVTSSESFAHHGRCHLYLQPQGQNYPDFLKEIDESDSMEKARKVMGKY